MSLKLIDTPLLPSLACVLVIALVAAGCGKQDDAAAARTAPVAAPAQPVAAMSTEAVFQQCQKRTPAGGKADERPPVDANGYYHTPTDCPECTKDWWRTNQDIVLRSRPSDDAPEAGQVKASNWVQLLEDVALTKPTRGVVVAAGGGLQACDVVYAIDSVFEEGEHVHDRVWRDGKVFLVGSESDGPSVGSARAIVRFDDVPQSGFSDNRWVKLRGPGGSSGWARAQDGGFACMWANDRYLDDKPTVCATPPGSAAKDK